MTRKDELRAAFIERRGAVTEEERQSAAKAAGVLFSNFTLFKQRSCCAYLSNNNEMPTRHFIRQIFAWKSTLCVPAWDPASKSYHLCAFDAQTKVATGRFGIREPEQRIPVGMGGIRLFLVPGVCFDADGNRLGHGKGYYDSILARAAPEALKVGVCYDWQISTEPLPAEPHDIAMDFLLTDRRIVCCNPKKLEKQGVE